MKYEIPKEAWHICKICQASIKDLSKVYGKSGKYYTEVFTEHLINDHQISTDDYFIKFDNQKICCKDCNKLCKISKSKIPNFFWKNMCGNNDGIKEWSKKAKETRKGKGNPMFNKKPWNLGLSTDDPRIEKMVCGRRGKKLTQTHKEKLSKAAKKFIEAGNKRGMSGKIHSDETKEKLRQSTLKNINLGLFKRTKTQPHLKIKEILENLNIKFEEEKIVKFWTFDFYLIDYDVYIEVDGDYFHSNPNTRWPDGPKTKTQIKVHKNDIKKNKFAKDNNMSLYRFWENDILNNTEIVLEKIKCIVQKSNKSDI